MAMTTNPFVYIIIVNYDGWRHTIECLESILRIDYEPYRIVLIDNGSGDNSMHCITEWAEGRFDLNQDNSHLLRVFSYTPVVKPIKYKMAATDSMVECINDERLIIVKSDINLGFAGANNIGIRLALSDNWCRYLWLLNNDTVVKPDSLKELVSRMGSLLVQGHKMGIIGSKLLYYQAPEMINAMGGRYYRLIGKPRQIGMGEIDRGQYDKSQYNIDYIAGASMFINRDFVLDRGFMCEDYFLYYEELDWSLRGRQVGWEIALCPESIVYHKEGSSIGSSKRDHRKSLVTDYYVFRNRLLLTKKFFPNCIISVLLSSLAAVLLRVIGGDISRLKTFLRAVLDGLGNKKGYVDYV